MGTLVYQFAAAGDCGIGPPFLFITDASAVSVATADEHKLAERARGDQSLRLAQRTVVAVIEAHMHLHALVVPRRKDRLELRRKARGWLFDEDVLACLHRGKRDFGKRVVGRRNDDHVNVRIVSDNPPVRYGASAGWTGKRLRPVQGNVRASEQLISRRLLDVADKLCGGSLTPLLMNLVRAKPLSAREVQELQDLLQELNKQTRSRKKPR